MIIVPNPPEFVAWPKIPRWHRDVTITEKIDGTNACVVVTEDGVVYAQSRKRIITPEHDNFGFARWTQDHAGALLGLGVGHHFGEWYGLGIQRGYGLDEKRFALFNTLRWSGDNHPPGCCGVVPAIYSGFNAAYLNEYIRNAKYLLTSRGSIAVPGYDKPEGLVIFHHAARSTFKVLLEGDEIPKGEWAPDDNQR